MLKSVYLPEEQDSDTDYEILNKSDLPETVDSQTKPSTISKIANYAADELKQGFVTTSSIIGGCATVAVMTPYAVRAVSCHLLPSAAVPGVMASTVNGSLTVASYSLGSKAAAMGAEAISDVSSTAMIYLFNQANTKTKAVPKTQIEITTLKPKII